MKREYIVLGVLIVALVLYIVLKNTDRTHYELPETARIEKTDVTKVAISRGDSTVTLERLDERWLIEPQGYPADQGQVDKMLDAIADFELVTLVSESKSYAQYDLDDEGKIGIEVFGGNDLLVTFEIGKPASTYRHTYVRLGGDDNVYRARENVRRPFEVERAKLRDRVVSRFDKVTVTSVSLAETGGEPFTIHRNEEPPVPDPQEGDSAAAAAGPAPEWTAGDGRPARKDAVDRIVNACADMQCDSFLEGMTKADFADPIFTLTIEADRPVTIEIFEKREGEENKHPAVSSQSDYPFLLPVYRVQQLMKKPGDILEPDEG